MAEWPSRLCGNAQGGACVAGAVFLGSCCGPRTVDLTTAAVR